MVVVKVFLILPAIEIGHNDWPVRGSTIRVQQGCAAISCVVLPVGRGRGWGMMGFPVTHGRLPVAVAVDGGFQEEIGCGHRGGWMLTSGFVEVIEFIVEHIHGHFLFVIR